MTIARRIKNRMLRARGRAKQQAGRLTHNNRLRAEGLADQGRAAIGTDVDVLKDVVAEDLRTLRNL
jgi:uncharacterized protein YjbJ (UPF0337 family)